MLPGMTTDDYEPVLGDGETDFDEDVALMIVRGKASFLPRSLLKLDTEARAVLGDVARQAFAVREAQSDLRRLVAEGRDVGASWSALGFCLATTGEAARQRFGAEA